MNMAVENQLLINLSYETLVSVTTLETSLIQTIKPRKQLHSYYMVSLVTASQTIESLVEF